VTVTARCQTHTDKSNTSSGLSVNVQDPEETITQPGTPTGETSPFKGVSYTYTTSGATSNLGHTLEYSFSWGEDTTSSWSTSKSASHSWSTTGSKTVTVTARCQTHIDRSSTSSGLSVNVQGSEETINQPGKPIGETKPIEYVKYTYMTSGATSNLGHTLEYSFSWGDSTSSPWLPVKSASHSWSTTGTKIVTVTARCKIHTDKSAISSELYVSVQYPVETVTQPGLPIGEASPIRGVKYTYTTGGAISNMGHTLEYSFSWGDGMSSPWSPSKNASHIWNTTGTKTVTVTARCQTHTDKSSTSDGLRVTVVKGNDQNPYLTACYPPSGGLKIPRNTGIQFRVNDTGYGIDLSSLNVSINGVAILRNGVDQTNNRLENSSDSYGYHIHYYPDYDFMEGSVITVHVQCQDMASPSNIMDVSYSFSIGPSYLTTTDIYSVNQTGGVITDVNTGIQINIPPDALEGSTTITISQVENPPALPDTVNGIGLSYHFGPAGLQFADSVIIRVPFNREDLECAGILNPLYLPVYYFSINQGKWMKLKILDASESYIYVKVKEFCYFSYGKLISTEVKETGFKNLLPLEFELMQNYPNPFNPETIIGYHLPRDGYVTIEIYNVIGQRVRILVDGVKEAGFHEVVWDGRDEYGKIVSSGMYIYFMKTGGGLKMKRASFNK